MLWRSKSLLLRDFTRYWQRKTQVASSVALISKRRLPPDVLRGKASEIGDVMLSVLLEDWGV